MKRNIAIGAALVVAFSLSVVMTPRKLVADAGPKIDLETMIPKQFGEWAIDEAVMTVIASPEVQAKLDLIYNQTLSRTYVNSRGERVMLAIAYGGDQSDSMQVHKPEVCYPAQGLSIIKQQDGLLKIAHGTIPVRRLVAQQGRRYEPITYWIRMGDTVAVDSVQQKLTKLAYAISGEIPDGLLFRISSVGSPEMEGFNLQGSFVNDLLHVLSSADQRFIVGELSMGS